MNEYNDTRTMLHGMANMPNRARGTMVVNVSDIALAGNALNAQPTSSKSK